MMKKIIVKELNDFKNIVDILKEDKKVKINLAEADYKIKIKILDLISGYIYEKGTILKENAYEFIVTIESHENDINQNKNLDWTNNKEEAIKVISENGLKLQHVNYELRNNEEVCLAAFKNHLGAFDYMSERLKEDKEFLIKLLKIKPYLLPYIDEKFYSDEDIIETAVSKKGSLLKYAAPKIKRKRFITKLIKNCGLILKDLEILSNESEIGRCAINDNIFAYDYLFRTLKHNKEFIKIFDEKIRNKNLLEDGKQKFIEYFDGGVEFTDYDTIRYIIEKEGQGLYLSVANKEIQDDYDMVLATVKENPLAIAYASERLKNDIFIVSNAVRKNGLSLYFASDIIKKNKQIVGYAVEENSAAIKYADKSIQNDEDIKNKGE